MPKNWLSYDEQVALLAERGLAIEDGDEAIDLLSRVGYYRLSGYFRYWQLDPAKGDNRFVDGASFSVIRDLYLAEQSLEVLCDDILHPIEVMLRTRFAYSYAQRVGAIGKFARGEGFTQPPDPSAERVEEHALSNLDRSKEPFVGHYRAELKVGNHYEAAAYDHMPIWAAVEAFTFGTVSRLITASAQSGVLDDIAGSMSVSRAMLPSQIRSFVYLRNRIAHCAKLWNHSVLDVPGLLPNASRRARKNHRQFDDHSVYKIFVALDDVASKSGVVRGWLTDHVDPILNQNPLLAAGIATPRKYGEMDFGALRLE